MKIFVDLRHWSPLGYTGVGQVARQATLAMLRAEAHSEFMLLAHPAILAGIEAPNAVGVPCEIPLDRHPANEWLEQVEIPRLLRLHKAQVFLGFENRVPLLSPVPVATWIHDASSHRFPKAHSLRYQLLMRSSIALARRRADLVFAPSAFAAQECSSCYGIDAHKLRVAPLGSSGLPLLPRNSSPSPYMLCVGATNPRKNLPLLLQAFASLAEEFPDARLRVTGSLREWERLHAEGLRIPPRVEFLGHVDESCLASLYSEAAGALNPSLYEGFGIPLLDAALAGCPVACSSIAPHRAILGESGLWFDPQDTLQMASCMRKLLSHDPAARPEPVQDFSWDRCAQAMLQSFKGII